MLRRVRKFLSRDSSSSCCCKEAESFLINVNQYAPIDESIFELTKTEKDLKRKNKKIKSKKKTKSSQQRQHGPICKVLRLGASGPQEQNRKGSRPLVASLWLEEGLDLSSLSIERYQREFQELELIGRGKFGSVYRCAHRLDGREYAVKRSRSLTRSAFGQRRARNEVHANAALLGHPNVVRYYGAWLEDGRLHIQQEYCDGGDLNALVERMRDRCKFFREAELQRLAEHVARGLEHLHSHNLAHMDLKPENVFRLRTRNTARSNSVVARRDEDFDEVVWKIGDMGHVTPVDNVRELEDEGDSRYLPKEILSDDYSNLPKADVFALGLMLYDVAGGGPLPQYGPEWHSLREGNLRTFLRYSDDFHIFLKRMIHLDPKKRFSADDIIRCNYLYKNTDLLAEWR